MSEPKTQHVIPQCYLKQFVDPNTPADQEPYVWIFERDRKRGKKRAPKNILTETLEARQTDRLQQKSST